MSFKRRDALTQNLASYLMVAFKHTGLFITDRKRVSAIRISPEVDYMMYGVQFWSHQEKGPLQAITASWRGLQGYCADLDGPDRPEYVTVPGCSR